MVPILSLGYCDLGPVLIGKPWNSLNIDLIDKPKHLPKELLYDVFVVYWDDYVQHLPSSGFEWDLCTGDQNTCPFGIYCDCNKTFDFADMNLIPEAK